MTPKKTHATAAEEKNAAPVEVPPLNSPQLYINRELSLLSFQFRVLEEAQDEKNPLLERVKFLSIVGSNMDEFFMVRVAGLIDQVDAGILEVGPDGMHPTAQLVAIRREVKKLLAEAHKCLHDQLLPELAEAGIQILDYAALNEKQLAVADTYFTRDGFSGPDAAGLRSRPSVSAHLEPEPEPGGADSRQGRRRAFRAREGAGFAAAVRAAEAPAQEEPQARPARGDFRLAGAGDLGQPAGAVSRHGRD